jgi:hypothetical protein
MAGNRFQKELTKLEGLLSSLNKKNRSRVSRGGAKKPAKKNSDDSRYFKLVNVNGKHVEDGGRYELPLRTKTGKPQRRGPKDKASTAFSELCQKHKRKEDCKFKFAIQETTRGSDKKVYHYEGKRVKLSKPVVLKLKDKRTGKVKTVTKKYTNVIKSLGSEHSKNH